ncbi:MAG: signal peptidase I [Proteocatella sp.]
MIRESPRIKLISIVMIGIMAALYAIENLITIEAFNIRMLIPLIWVLMAIAIGIYFPRGRSHGKIRNKSKIYFWAFNFATAFIIINLGAGYVLGFGKSPYALTIRGISLNMFLLISVVGREFARDYILKAYPGHIKLSTIFVIVFMTLISISVTSFINVADFKSGVIFLAETLLPQLGENTISTMLVYFGGPWASIIYISMTRGITYLTPILPNLNWLAKASIGFGIPLVCTVFFNNEYLKLTRVIRASRNNDENVAAWVASMVISVVLIWFVAGVFPIYPSAIATGSMKPVIQPGDVVMMKRLSDVDQVKELKVGDVIQFKRQSILITHRIMAIEENEDGEVKITTKGDNNSGFDSEKVGVEDLRGRLVKVVPKVGWPTLLLKSGNRILDTKVEF